MEPFIAVLVKLLKRGVEIRLIHAKEPGPAFREDFDRYPILKMDWTVAMYASPLQDAHI